MNKDMDYMINLGDKVQRCESMNNDGHQIYSQEAFLVIEWLRFGSFPFIYYVIIQSSSLIGRVGKRPNVVSDERVGGPNFNFICTTFEMCVKICVAAYEKIAF